MDFNVKPMGQICLSEAKPRVIKLSQAEQDYAVCLSRILETRGVIRIAIDTGCKSTYLRFDKERKLLKRRLSKI